MAPVACELVSIFVPISLCISEEFEVEDADELNVELPFETAMIVPFVTLRPHVAWTCEANIFASDSLKTKTGSSVK